MASLLSPDGLYKCWKCTLAYVASASKRSFVLASDFLAIPSQDDTTLLAHLVNWRVRHELLMWMVVNWSQRNGARQWLHSSMSRERQIDGGNAIVVGALRLQMCFRTSTVKN
jgi:hypothetical protein